VTCGNADAFQTLRPIRALQRKAGPAGNEGGGQRGLREPLSQSEIRVLRYLPTKLSAPEIADQLYLSVNTVKTHMRHVYDKLGAHRRHEAVEQARALGLLAPSQRRP
jgi:LuxR family transcriptional regulator, maltose regulon positive regulatory protein